MNNIIIGYGINTNPKTFWRKDSAYDLLNNHMCSSVFNELVEFYKENRTKYRLNDRTSIEKLADDFAMQYTSIDEENAGTTGLPALITDLINAEHNLTNHRMQTRYGFIYVPAEVPESKENASELITKKEAYDLIGEYVSSICAWDYPGCHMYNITPAD